jgi:hypothetical protein
VLERLTPRARKVIELALRESLQLGHSYVGTEHILLGMARKNEGVASGYSTGSRQGGRVCLTARK